MPFTRPNLTRPQPRPHQPRIPRRAVKPAPGAGAPFSQQLGTWNFAVRVYVAWDPATTAAPNWIEVTEFVDIPAGISIRRGRPDAEQACQVGTCALTVDNSDGRWSPSNPNGVWFGQIRKGCWLRVDVIPPSQTVSTRFTGFIQTLPVSWEGQYSKVLLSASDRFVLLGNAPKYQSAIVEEWLNDPVGSQYIAGYWPLHEPSSATYASDISGNAPAAQATLSQRSIGVNPGVGLSFSNTASPGYDGLSTVTFAPTGTPWSMFGGTGALPSGTCLQGTVGPMGNVAQVSCWIQTTVAYQPIWSWCDPASNYGMALMLNSSGQVLVTQYPLNGSTSAIADIGTLVVANYPVNDGIWHHISVKFQTPASLPALGAFVSFVLDGQYSFGYFCGTNVATQTVWQSTVSQFTVGAAQSWGYLGQSIPAGQFAFYTGSISDLVVHQFPNTTINPDWYGVYQAGTTMWQSPGAAYPVAESCGRRVVRLAQYAGVPAPVQSFSLPNFGNPAFDVTTGVTPFINIPAETAHPAGMQQLQAQQQLTALQVVAATENMPVFVDKQGRITLQPSTLRQNPATAFTINALDLDKSTAWADDFQYLENQQVITPSGQGSLTVDTNGAASQTLNGVYSNSTTTVTVNALESGSLGAAMNLAGANPQPRHNPLACEIATLATQTGYGAAFYDAVLASEISSVVAVTNWPATSASASSGSYYIEGYAETISGGNHLFAWNTSPAQGPTYQCDSATLGLIDTPGITLAY